MKSIRLQLYLIGLIFLLMTTFSSALEGSFSYDSETSETPILEIYESSGHYKISLIIIVEILENANISVGQIQEDTIRAHLITKIGEYHFNFTVRKVHLVIESSFSHFNGTTITPMSNQASDVAKAEGTYSIEIIEQIDNYVYFESITTLALSLLGIGIITNKLKTDRKLEY